MSMRLNFKRFAKECQFATGVDVDTLAKECEKKRALFEHLLFDVSDVKDAADIPTEVLLSMVNYTKYFFGGTAPWVERIEDHQAAMQTAHTVRRVRVL